jgi:hypothetical protein
MDLVGWAPGAWADGSWVPDSWGVSSTPIVLTDAGLRLVPFNFADEATLSSSPGGATDTDGRVLGVSNLQNMRRTSVFRSNTVSSLDITGHWGGAIRTVDFIGLFNHRIHGAQWAIHLYSDVGMSSEVLNVFGGSQDIASVIPISGYTFGTDDYRNSDPSYYMQDALPI